MLRNQPATFACCASCSWQGNIPQSLKFDESEKPMIFDRYRSLTTTATLEHADLIIWPRLPHLNRSGMIRKLCSRHKCHRENTVVPSDRHD